MRIKFQTLLFRYPADHEGIVSLENCLAGSAAAGESKAGEAVLGAEACALIYWATGAIAGCAVNAFNTNKTYDGEYQMDTSYTQKELEAAIKDGKFILHH